MAKQRFSKAAVAEYADPIVSNIRKAHGFRAEHGTVVNIEAWFKDLFRDHPETARALMERAMSYGRQEALESLMERFDIGDYGEVR